MMLLLHICLFLFDLALSESTGLGIINGTIANITDYPWMAGIYDEIEGFICGGSLISPDWALTAGHCAEFQNITSIQVGSNHRNHGEVVGVAEVIVHPNYTHKGDWSPLNDLTLLRLSSSTNGSNIAPIRLPEPDAPVPVGEYISVTGWGDTNGHDHYPKYLQVTKVIIPAIESCIEAYTEQDCIVDKETEFCAGTIGIAQGSCHGDSGGPAEINGTLLGMVSWGVDGCATSKMPQVLVKIATYRNWIHDVTGI